MFDDGTLRSELKGENRIFIGGLGTVIATSEYQTKDKDKRLEIAYMVAEVNGEADSLQKCRDIYSEYLKYPEEETRFLLKAAYEAVPEHKRMYLGDMDSRDSDYVRIIYHPEIKHEV